MKALELTIADLKQENFEVKIWVSIPRSPWCSWKSVNLKTVPNFEERLKEMRDESLILVDNVKEVIESTKCESYFEWPKNNDGWKNPKVEELLKSMPRSTEFDGCAYGLKNSEGKAMKKTWNVVSTHDRIKDYVNRKCSCTEDHAQVRGKDGKATEEYTEDLVEAIVQCLMKENIMVKPVRKPMTKDELELHQRRGHDPYDSRCKDCLLGGIKDRPHYRRSDNREENTLAIDIAGRFKLGRGEDGMGYKYLMVATFKAVNRNWKESTDEATEEVQRAEEEREKETDDAFYPQDPIPESESVPQEQEEKKAELF
jgi:hypothetical protein